MVKKDPELIDLISDLRQGLAGQTETRNVDPFEFISANELALSKIICWFLDPNASHGEGVKFFALFCKTFAILLPEQAHAKRARCEIATEANRRIDIVVECDKFTVAIENKPYSAFSEMQLPDYFEYLKGTGGSFALVALKGWAGTISAEQIVSANDDTGQFVDADYHMLVEWLDSCAAASERAEVQLFAKQFKRHAGQHVLGVENLGEMQEVARLVQNDVERQHSALEIIDAASLIEKGLHKKLTSAMADKSPKNWRISSAGGERTGNTISGFHYLSIDFDPAWPVLFVFEIGPRSNTAYLGVARRQGVNLTKASAEPIWLALDKQIVTCPLGGNSSWLWWAQQHFFIEHDLFDETHAHVWHAMVEPDALAFKISELANRVECVIRDVLQRV